MAAHKGNCGFAAQREKSALQRFAEKCAFDPTTGCVMWVGGTTSGRGHSSPYGTFWFEGRRWFAHRWAALHIHGEEIDGLQVDHCCPAGPHTLCVEHVKPETAEYNRELQHSRPGRCDQTTEQRKYWAFVTKGLEPEPELAERCPDDIAFFEPPEWLRDFLGAWDTGDQQEDCPF